MATTEHNLKIKAILDTSQIKDQLNGLKSTSSVGGGMNASMDLNNAINRLIHSLDKLPGNIEKAQRSSEGRFNGIAMGRFALSYGVGKVGNSVADLLDAKGHTQAKGIQSALTNIGSGALAGSAFGPAGAALGAAFGAATTAIDLWTDSVKKSQEELQKWNDIIKQAKETEEKERKDRFDRYSNDFYKQAVERGDKASLQQVRDQQYEKNLSARELQTQDLSEMLEKKKSIEEQIKDVQSREKKIHFMPSTGGGTTVETGDLSKEEVDKKVKELTSSLDDLNKKIEERKKTSEVIAESDKEIAAADAALAEIKRREANERRNLVDNLDDETLIKKRDELADQNEKRKKKLAEDWVAANERGDENAKQKLKTEEKIAEETDNDITEIDKAIAEVERKKLEIKKREAEEAAANAKRRAEYEASLNQAIQDQIDAFKRNEETDATRKLIESNDFVKMAEEKKKQEEIASSSKADYQSFLEQAKNASTPEGKEFLMAQADESKTNWMQAQKQVDALANAQDSFTSMIANEVKSRQDAAKESGPLDTSVNDFSQSYKAGLGIGEVGYDVSQDKQDKVIDIATVIKDILAEMRAEQRVQTEVQREAKKQGLL